MSIIAWKFVFLLWAVYFGSVFVARLRLKQRVKSLTILFMTIGIVGFIFLQMGGGALV